MRTYGLWVRGVRGAAEEDWERHGWEEVGQRMGFKYDPRALREAVFGGASGAAGAMKRRKVERAVEEGGEHTKDRGEAKEEEQAREDVVLLAEDATNERIVFVYRGLRPVQVLPTNTGKDKDKDKDKDKNAANATPGIGSKRPREEQDDECGVVYDVFRERRVGDRKDQAIGSTSSTVAPAASTTVTSTTTVSEGTTRGVRFAEGSKVIDGGGTPQRRCRLGTGTGTGSAGAGAGAGGNGGKVVCESDVEFGKDGVCLWVEVAPPPPAAETTSTTSTAAAAITSSSTNTTTTTTTATTTTAGKEKEPRLTRLEVQCHGKTRTAETKDERRGVIFPCKVWRWRPPPRITTRSGEGGGG